MLCSTAPSLSGGEREWLVARDRGEPMVTRLHEFRGHKYSPLDCTRRFGGSSATVVMIFLSDHKDMEHVGRNAASICWPDLYQCWRFTVFVNVIAHRETSILQADWAASLRRKF
jgi:hypothetical protein